MWKLILKYRALDNDVFDYNSLDQVLEAIPTIRLSIEKITALNEIVIQPTEWWNK